MTLKRIHTSSQKLKYAMKHIYNQKKHIFVSFAAVQYLNRLLDIKHHLIKSLANCTKHQWYKKQLHYINCLPMNLE